MRLLWEGLLTLLSALGLAMLGTLLFGRLLRPAAGPEVFMVVPASGGGDSLERDLRCLMWLRRLGLLRCPVAVADAGLDGGGRELAARCARRWPGVRVLEPAELAALAREQVHL